MTTGFLQKIFGSRNQRLIKQYQKTVAVINALEPQIEQLTDDELRAKTEEFRQRVASGEALDNLLPEALERLLGGSRQRNTSPPAEQHQGNGHNRLVDKRLPNRVRLGSGAADFEPQRASDAAPVRSSEATDAFYTFCAAGVSGSLRIEGGAATPFVGWMTILQDLFAQARRDGQLRQGLLPAPVARALPTVSSVRLLVRNAPPMLALRLR